MPHKFYPPPPTPAGVSDAAMYGLLAMAFDPSIIGTSGTALGGNGTLYVQRLFTPVALSVTNIVAFIVTAGATLTAGQSGAALYSSSKALLGQTANMSTTWNSTGLKTMPLVGGPDAVPAGEFFVVLWSNGTTRPAFAKGGTSIGVNGALAAGQGRYMSANTGITTTAPATLGAFMNTNNSYWVGVS